jgi:hypothetical protein
MLLRSPAKARRVQGGGPQSKLSYSNISRRRKWYQIGPRTKREIINEASGVRRKTATESPTRGATKEREGVAITIDKRSPRENKAITRGSHPEGPR